MHSVRLHLLITFGGLDLNVLIDSFSSILKDRNDVISSFGFHLEIAIVMQYLKNKRNGDVVLVFETLSNCWPTLI